ncbi:Uridine kinase [Streptomyces purpurascens]
MLLCGPSGSGKSLLAARSGLPVLRLDDFYKEGDDPTLPSVEGSSDIDWDHPDSWDADTAVTAITQLCRTGRTAVPVYDLSLSARTGEETVEIGRTPLFLAEGIFAAEIVTRCRELGLLADALCLSRGPVKTFRRRFLRDLKEGRQVGAVPAAPRLAPDAAGALDRRPPDRAGRVRLRPRRGDGPAGGCCGGPVRESPYGGLSGDDAGRAA